MGLFSSLFGGGDDSSQDYLKQALSQFQNIQTPTADQMKVSGLPQETVQGTVNPETLTAAQQGNTEFNNISLDPATRAAQIQALGGFTNIAGAGGLDANAKLGIQQAVDAANSQNAGMQGAIMQNAEATGNGGSGATLTQRLLAAQNSANTTANQGLQQAAEAEANRQNALSQMANIGGSVNASDYSQQANKAASQNAINATNTAAENAARATNVGNNMSGQEFNVGTAQGVNTRNTSANQGNAYYNAQLPQQVFNNNIAKASGAAGVNTNQANVAQTNQNQQNAMLGTLIGSGAKVAGAYMGASKGGAVPGKAVVPGDSEVNDTEPIMASPGELVIPRSVPKTGPEMEKFAKNAPIAGDPKKRVNLVDFMKKKKAA